MNADELIEQLIDQRNQLQRALEKACEYLVQEDVCIPSASSIANIAICPLVSEGQEPDCEECWIRHLKQEEDK